MRKHHIIGLAFGAAFGALFSMLAFAGLRIAWYLALPGLVAEFFTGLAQRWGWPVGRELVYVTTNSAFYAGIGVLAANTAVRARRKRVSSTPSAPECPICGLRWAVPDRPRCPQCGHLSFAPWARS